MALSVFEDRGMVVPDGKVVRTGYVGIERVSMACRDRMAIGDVQNAMSRRMSASVAGGQAFPCPVGHWDQTLFVIEDGRHEYIAALMLGVEHLLVAWIE